MRSLKNGLSYAYCLRNDVRNVTKLRYVIFCKKEGGKLCHYSRVSHDLRVVMFKSGVGYICHTREKSDVMRVR